MMNIDKIIDVTIKAEMVNRLAKVAIEEQAEQDKLFNERFPGSELSSQSLGGTSTSGALRRASMELTRALARMRSTQDAGQRRVFRQGNVRRLRSGVGKGVAQCH